MSLASPLRPPRVLLAAAVAACALAAIPLVYLLVRVASAGAAEVLELLTARVPGVVAVRVASGAAGSSR